MIVFAKNSFLASFCQKDLKFLNFSKQNRHSPLPTAFLNFDVFFLQKYLEDPFAYCLAALATS